MPPPWALGASYPGAYGGSAAGAAAYAPPAFGVGTPALSAGATSAAGTPMMISSTGMPSYAMGGSALQGTGIGASGASAAAPAAASGMSVLGGVTLAAALAGYGMNALGEIQGGRAMLREGGRQIAEQRGIEGQRQALVQQHLQGLKNSPIGLQMESGAQQQVQRGINAIAPSARAGGRALGINAAGIDRVQSAMLPQMQVAARGAAEGDRAQREWVNRTQLGMDTARIAQYGEDLAATYGADMAAASMHGQPLRTGGQLLSSLGMSGLSLGMGQAKKA